VKPHHRLLWPLIPLHQTLQRRVHDLDYLFLEITQRCNLRCLHCGSDCIQNTDTTDLPVSVALEVLGEIRSRLNPRRLTVAITGGEPLCHPGLFDLGRGIVELGFPWGMVTNGWGWTDALIDRAMASGIQTLTVSLDGLADTHDWLRGRPSSYERASATIERFAGSGRLQAMDVVTCVNQRNIHQLPELHQRLVDLGCPAWRLFTISPIGRAVDVPELHLTPAHYHQLLATIRDIRPTSPMEVALSESGYLGPGHELTVRSFPFFCRAGVSTGGIMVDGGIMACPNIDRSLVQGNVHTESFVDVWERQFEAFRDRSWLRTGPCADCPEWRHCQGGPMHLRREGVSGPLVCHWQDYDLG